MGFVPRRDRLSRYSLLTGSRTVDDAHRREFRHRLTRVGEGPILGRRGRTRLPRPLWSSHEKAPSAVVPGDRAVRAVGRVHFRKRWRTGWLRGHHRNHLPNESGLPNHADFFPGCTDTSCLDNHDVLTGSDKSGMLFPGSTTCEDWTSAVNTKIRPMVGHSWPASSGTNWMNAHNATGCLPGTFMNIASGPTSTVGAAGGYGGIYCFALTP
jgi:hypothetical protein